MKLTINLLLCWLALANLACALAEEPGTVSAALETNSVAYDQTYAVIVAIADYQHGQRGTGDLTYPVNDAMKFYQLLTSAPKTKVPKRNVMVLKNANATKKGILAALDLTFSKAGPNDRVIFYYSGHGEHNQLIPYEAHPQRTDDRIRYSEIKEVFKECAARTKVCFIDACFANSIKLKEAKKERSKRFSSELAKSDIVVMVSSQSYQTSIEYKALKQGVFSYFLLKGMEGQADRNRDTQVTIAELHKYVYQNVKVYTQNKQVPHTFGNFNRNMPIVVLSN